MNSRFHHKNAEEIFFHKNRLFYHNIFILSLLFKGGDTAFYFFYYSHGMDISALNLLFSQASFCSLSYENEWCLSFY